MKIKTFIKNYMIEIEKNKFIFPDDLYLHIMELYIKRTQKRKVYSNYFAKLDNTWVVSISLMRGGITLSREVYEVFNNNLEFIIYIEDNKLFIQFKFSDKFETYHTDIYPLTNFKLLHAEICDFKTKNKKITIDDKMYRGIKWES